MCWLNADAIYDDHCWPLPGVPLRDEADRRFPRGGDWLAPGTGDCGPGTGRSAAAVDLSQRRHGFRPGAGPRKLCAAASWPCPERLPRGAPGRATAPPRENQADAGTEHSAGGQLGVQGRRGREAGTRQRAVAAAARIGTARDSNGPLTLQPAESTLCLACASGGYETSLGHTASLCSSRASHSSTTAAGDVRSRPVSASTRRSR
jgi:hypothetical protein